MSNSYITYILICAKQFLSTQQRAYQSFSSYVCIAVARLVNLRHEHCNMNMNYSYPSTMYDKEIGINPVVSRSW